MLPAVSYNSASHWINSSPGATDVPLTPPAEEFTAFDPVNHVEPSEVPPLHTDYLLRKLARGERALGFVFVPHVLVAAPIDSTGLQPEDL